jgi:hypothetical protein
MLITNILHLEGADSREPLPAAFLKLRDHLHHIVQAATSVEHAHFVTGIPCRRRMNRKPCAGLIVVERTDVPGPFIHWLCDACKDEGRISDFKESLYNLSRRPSSLGKEIDPGEKRLSVDLTCAEYKAWIQGDLIPYDPDSMRLIYSAYADGEGVVLTGWEGDLDFLRDATAADANHEPNRRRGKLMDSIFRKLTAALEEAMEARESRTH